MLALALAQALHMRFFVYLFWGLELLYLVTIYGCLTPVGVRSMRDISYLYPLFTVN